MIFVNGKEEKLEKIKISDYLSGLGYNMSRIAVEYNGDILPKSEYENTVLCDGDRIEIVHFVGGG